jgi:hypothetical protein
MPKNTACPGVPWVSDPITDQEIAFAHLIMSGTMNDRAAAEAVGLNPDTAAYTKAKPRVRAYVTEHRAAVNEKLVDQEADLSRLPRLAEGRAVDGLRQLNLGRDQILTRLWELATLSHEVTKGSIAGQIKALAMIIAIEGLDPNRRLSSSAGTQPAAPSVKPQIYNDKWRPEPQQQPAGGEPGGPVAGTKASPPAPQVTHPEHAREPKPEPDPKLANHMSSPNLDRNQPSVLNPFINPKKLNPVPPATDYVFDAVLTSASSHRLSFAPETGFSALRW